MFHWAKRLLGFFSYNPDKDPYKDVFYSTWLSQYNMLLSYIRDNDKMPPVTYTSHDGIQLGSWINAQKIAYFEKQLSQNQIEYLEELPKYAWDTELMRWKYMYHNVVRCTKLHDSIPQPLDDNRNPEDPYTWLKLQEFLYYYSNKLTQEQISLLEGLPEYAWHAKRVRWNRSYYELYTYATEHHSLPPHNYISHKSGLKLGRFVEKQRSRYKASQLDAYQVEHLEQIPCWNWHPIATKWNRAFNDLLAYVSEHNGLPTQKYIGPKSGLRLDTWFSRQKRNYKKNRLSDAQIHLIESVLRVDLKT